MSKEAPPDKAVTTKEEDKNSETIELTTFYKDQQREIVLTPPPPAQFSETQFGRYTDIEEGIMQRPSQSKAHFADQPCTSSQGYTLQEPQLSNQSSILQEPHSSSYGSSTFHRFSTVENDEVVQRENKTYDRVQQGEGVVPRFGNIAGYNTEITDDSMNFRTRLKIKKRRLPFIAYAFYAIEEIYQEVEKILFLDIAFLIFSIGVSVLGLKRVADCPCLSTIPVAIVVSGVVDAFVNVLSIYAAFTKRPSVKEALLDIIRMGRLTLFFVHIYGLVKVYSILPPDASDKNSLEYCESLLYWTSFAFFHITFLSSTVVIVSMAAAIAYFYV